MSKTKIFTCPLFFFAPKTLYPLEPTRLQVGSQDRCLKSQQGALLETLTKPLGGTSQMDSLMFMSPRWRSWRFVGWYVTPFCTVCRSYESTGRNSQERSNQQCTPIALKRSALYNPMRPMSFLSMSGKSSNDTSVLLENVISAS
jgi:hypothetical protein